MDNSPQNPTPSAGTAAPAPPAASTARREGRPRLPSARAGAVLATVMLGTGIAVGAAIGPAPETSLAGSAGIVQKLPALIAAVTAHGRSQASSPAAKTPAAAPAIHPNYLATPEDRHVAADSIRVARRIVAQPALQKYSPVEYLPGAQVRDDDEAGLIKAAGDIGTTIFHPVGTARMGRADDANAVVDARLRVIGVDGLRVADASVMPSITSGNTNSPTMMIAEKGAAMILEDRQR